MSKFQVVDHVQNIRCLPEAVRNSITSSSSSEMDRKNIEVIPKSPLFSSTKAQASTKLFRTCHLC